MDHLHSLSKKGNEFIQNLLSKEIDINLKIDTSAFVVRIDHDKVRFLGREGRAEISKSKRATMDLYEPFIEFVEEKESKILKQLPSGLEIYCEMFSPSLKTIIKYDHYPKNNLIISYCILNGKVLSPSDNLVSKAADILDIASAPVIHSGKLTEVQKKKIIEFIYSDSETRKEKFGGSNFSSMLFSLFSGLHQYKNLTVGGMEGLVFYFKDNGSSITSKVVDPLFTEEIKDKKAKSLEDEYNIILMKYCHDISHLKNQVESALKDKTSIDYFHFILNLVKQFQKAHPEFYTATEKYKSDVLSNKFASLTYKFLPKEVKTIVEKNWQNEDLYRVFFNALTKEKKRASAGVPLTKEQFPEFNSLVQKIEEKYGSIILNDIPEPRKEKVSLILGRFQPLHKGHAAMIKSAKYRPYVMIVKGAETSKEKKTNPFDSEYQIELVQKAAKAGDIPNNTIVETTPHAHAGMIASILRQKGFEVAEIIAGEDRLSSYEENFKGINNVDNPKSYHIKFTQSKRLASATEVRASIHNKDRKSFDKLVPKSLSGEYDKMVSLMESEFKIVSFKQFREML